MKYFDKFYEVAKPLYDAITAAFYGAAMLGILYLPDENACVACANATECCQ